ncbi:hypothetical protein Taro_007621 [Colocasia esculenta]|uniref:Beta-Casp domain-containing protein n=1 Tax=Colocasia esculenta TaxID=4460 RepID=A0A843TYN1_COLES|nr:hypothetical protein [Colocasia esculenta]
MFVERQLDLTSVVAKLRASAEEGQRKEVSVGEDKRRRRWRPKMSLVAKNNCKRDLLSQRLARRIHCLWWQQISQLVHKCVAGGGKVLIPAFALGRAQELCILLDDYWERMNLNVPIFFSAGLTIQANMYYKTFIGWTSQKIKETSAVKNAFDFKHVCPFKPAMIHDPGPCVLFATPGMLTGGFSVEVFKQWAPSDKNLVTLPGYCLAGTLGHKLMSGKATTVDLDKDTHIEVQCQIHQLSFSPHTDAKGIMDLVGFLSPKHVILVHGEKPKMAILRGRIKSELGIECAYPENGQTVVIPTAQAVKVDATKAFLRSHYNTCFHSTENISDDLSSSASKDTVTKLLATESETVVEGFLVMEKTKRAKIMHRDELLQKLGMEENKVQFAYCCPVYISSTEQTTLHQLSGHSSNPQTLGLASCSTATLDNYPSRCPWLNWLLVKLREEMDFTGIEVTSDHLRLGSFHIRVCSKESCDRRIEETISPEKRTVFFCCSWSLEDEKLAWKILSLMRDSC